MSTIKMMKKWVLISMLFVGISLTVYAVAPTVVIKGLTLEEVSTTTATISVRHIGAEAVGWGIWIYGNNNIYDFGLCTAVNGPDEHGYYCSTFTITGLTPDTSYEVIVLAYEDINDIENSAYQSGSITFMTASIPSN